MKEDKKLLKEIKSKTLKINTKIKAGLWRLFNEKSNVSPYTIVLGLRG